MNKLKFASIPVLISLILLGGMWIASEPAVAAPDETFIAPPGPICRNGASGGAPNFDLAYADTSAGGMDLAFSVGFTPRINSFAPTQGYIESIGNIRFKPKLNSDGSRIVDEYWLALPAQRLDKISYPANELMPYFSETADAPAPYTLGMGPRIRQKPGSIWVVGNEVDREIAQDSLLPETFARAYHDAYVYIKSEDPTAQIAVSGLVNFGPDRRQYLDKVYNAYQSIYGEKMPVDIWTMHAYNIAGRHFGSQTPDAGLSSIALGTDPNLTWQTHLINLGGGNFDNDASRCDLSDVICFKEHDNVDLFKGQVIAMRQWMKDHGYQEKPLILREWGLNLTSDNCDENSNRITAQRAANYLTATVNWMDSHKDPSLGYNLDEGRLVQRWAWFIINEDINIPHEADISHLITDYGINYPACGSTDFPTKVPTGSGGFELTVVGQAYRDVVAAQNIATPPNVDFVIESVTNGAGVLASGSPTTTATLGVTVRNRGNSPTGQDTTVEFRDSSDNSLIGTFTIPASFQGCTTSLYHGTVQWELDAEGSHDFTVTVVSSEETTAEAANNSALGRAFVGNKAICLPIVQK